MMVTASDVKFDALRSAIYHASRANFFNFWTRVFNFLVVILGATAFADVTTEPKWFAGAAAVIGALQLVFDFAGKARDHQYLQRRFYELVANVADKWTADETQVAQWSAALHRLYADETTPMRALDAISHNAACDALGHDNHRVKVHFYQAALSQFWPFADSAFRTPDTGAKSA
jgi:hypothetical protein